MHYSVDFKKLYVKNLDSFGLFLSEDESVIHMNINLENVTDEELAELLEARIIKNFLNQLDENEIRDLFNL